MVMLMSDEKKFEVLPAGAMRAKYGLIAENRHVVKLNQERIPEGLRHLIPTAEKFGISDDLTREDFMAKASKAEVLGLKQLVETYNNLLDVWLAGPEAAGPSFSDEYIAFSCMRMAADGC
jgi:hypothetical protein